MASHTSILPIALAMALAGGAAQAQLPQRYDSPGGAPPAQPGVPGQPAAPQPRFEPLYVAVNQQPTGPFGAEEIARKIATREITPQTLVYAPGLGQWTPAGQVPVLAPLFAQQAQAAPPGIPPVPGGQPGGTQPSPFATPGSGSTAEEQRLQAYLIGEWMREEPMPYAPAVTRRTQVRFLPSGEFYAITTMLMQGLPGTTAPSRGRWQVQPMQERRFVVTTTGQEGANSTQVEIVDDNNMRDVVAGTIIRRIAR